MSLLKFGASRGAPAVPVFLVVAVAAGCTATATRTRLPEISLGSQTIVLQPTRDDLTVAELWMKIRCVQKPTSSAERPAYATCDQFSVEDEPIDYEKLIRLEPTGKNSFRLEPLLIRFSDSDQGHVCIAMKAVFNEVSHQHDDPFYVARGDRYSLLSFCTIRELPEWARGKFPFEQNRVDTLEEFAARLAAPIPINLRSEPPVGTGTSSE